MDGSSLQKKRCGRKKIDYRPKIDLIADIPLNMRSTIRSTASALGIPTSSLFRRASPTTIEELVAAVVNSYNVLNHTTLNDIFLTLQTVMEACILHDGNNNFKTPHVYKRRLENGGQLPVSIPLSQELEEKLASS